MKKILVAVDFSEGTGRLVNQALELGKELGGTIYVVHVTSDALQAAYESTQFYDFSSEYISASPGDVEMARTLCAEEYRREHQSLLNISARMRKDGVDARAMLLKGDAAELIVEKARELAVDMIVVGSHGHGILRKMLIGSVTEAVLRKALCSVLIVPVTKPVPVL
ncbi:MAG: universal stress protein [Kiritimatiellales bacterium]|nr:universal stress protein [Kiritimatiellota bacterium]MBL7012209.1 universal stress protein [Kiritimatiellales bacterium]